ncbi:hypothetical protein F52700_5210 [Fusarium sp. NRRL 52700]|nr:hypothetical protein F52700_5210 [Fusarium sp. NRRL 52700]
MVVVFKQKGDQEFWTNPTPEALIKECIEPYMRPCTDYATKTIRFTYEKENGNAQIMKAQMWPTFYKLQMFNDWEVHFKMPQMILQATFAIKPHRSPDLLCDADRLQAACGRECEVDVIANNLRVTVSTDCKDKDVVMTGLTIKMEQERMFKDWELVPGWTWKSEKKEHCCNIL